MVTELTAFMSTLSRSHLFCSVFSTCSDDITDKTLLREEPNSLKGSYNGVIVLVLWPTELSSRFVLLKRVVLTLYENDKSYLYMERIVNTYDETDGHRDECYRIPAYEISRNGA